MPSLAEPPINPKRRGTSRNSARRAFQTICSGVKTATATKIKTLDEWKASKLHISCGFRMPAATLNPPKRALGDATKVYRNMNNALPSPSGAKRRKLDVKSSPTKPKPSQKGLNGKLTSSQPKSQFEEDVLEKLTQDISGLKQNNSEKDQQWERPSLNDFDENRHDLCFQQIEAEEGTLHGGRTCIKLFGVTEVRELQGTCLGATDPSLSDWPFGFASCHGLPTLPLYCRSGFFRTERLRRFQIISRCSAGTTSTRYPFCADGSSHQPNEVPRQPKKSIPEDYCHRSEVHQPVTDVLREWRIKLQRPMERYRWRHHDL